MAKRATAPSADAVATRRPRGRPRGSTNGATTPARAAPARANGPSAARRAEVLADYTRLTTEGQRINQAKSTLLKNFQNEGGNTKALKLTHASLKLDPAEAAAHLRQLVEYHHGVGIQLKWLDTGQATVVDALGPEARKPAARTNGEVALAAARAHGDGYNSGLHGAAPSDNPFSHAPGSEEYVEWHNGRDDGQRDRDQGKPAQAARRDAASTADPTLPTEGAGAAPPF